MRKMTMDPSTLRVDTFPICAPRTAIAIATAEECYVTANDLCGTVDAPGCGGDSPACILTPGCLA